jgi:hypothetical protein
MNLFKQWLQTKNLIQVRFVGVMAPMPVRVSRAGCAHGGVFFRSWNLPSFVASSLRDVKVQTQDAAAKQAIKNTKLCSVCH